MSDEYTTLVVQLNRWNRRRRLRDALLRVPRGLLLGLLVGVVLALLSRLRPFLTATEVQWATLILMVVGVVAGLVAALLPRRSLYQRARFADAQFRLFDRAAAAVELAERRIAAPADLAHQQLADTLTAVSQVNTRDRLPLRLRRQDLYLILLALAFFLPSTLLGNPQASVLQEMRLIDETIAEQAEALEALQEEIEQNPDLTEAQQEALTEPLEAALEELQTQDLTQEEAVAALSEAEANLRELGNQNDPSDLQQQLQEAGRPLAGNAASQGLGEALQNGRLAEAGAQASRLADSLPELSEAERQSLAQNLAETAAQLAETDPQLAQQLQDAAAALAQDDTEAAQEALRDASGTLAQRNQELAAAQAAQNAAEQLNRSRQEVAQAGQQNQQGEQGQQGQGQQGQGEQGSGVGEGQGSAEGQGQQGQGDGSGSGSAVESGTGSGGPGQGGGSSETIFAPNATELSDLTEAEGVDIELEADCLANPDSCGALLNENNTRFGDEQSIVPYQDVFTQYRDSANEALSDGYIPLGLKGYIRDYFTSLEP